MRRIAIYAMIPSYPEPDPDVEVWSINMAYTRMDLLRHKLKRVYFMDDVAQLQMEAHSSLKRNFISDLNALDAEVYCKCHYEAIPKSHPIPALEMIERFGSPYFVCTVAWALAHAIYEKVDEITLAGMYHPHDSAEYMQHIPCINYWVGQALGRDIPVNVFGDSSVGKAFPFESSLYGFEGNELNQVALGFIGACYKAARDLPRNFIRTKEFDEIGLSNPSTEGYFTDDFDGSGGQGERQKVEVQAQRENRQ